MTPVATFLMEMCALEMTAPEASVTVPDTVAPVTCAQTGTETQRLSAKTTTVASLEAIFFEPILDITGPSPAESRLSPARGQLQGGVQHIEQYLALSDG